jgi:hypothetical protein
MQRMVIASCVNVAFALKYEALLSFTNSKTILQNSMRRTDLVSHFQDSQR